MFLEIEERTDEAKMVHSALTRTPGLRTPEDIELLIRLVFGIHLPIIQLISLIHDLCKTSSENQPTRGY